jgi:CspA family cold shock protein
MGKYRDHRGPRHGNDEDRSSASDRDAEPRYFQHSHSTASHSLEAEVMWFNADKGFGFIKASDGSEAYLHIRTLEAAGKSGVSEGMQLKVRIEEGQKGFQVSQVLEVRSAIAQTAPHERPGRGASTRPEMNAPEEESEGTVKWYNPEKGFGFIGLASADKDVFVHASALTRSGLAALAEGQKVTVKYAKGHKGLEVRTIRAT